MIKQINNWKTHWLLEAVRLKESQWGPIEDAVEVRRAVAAGGSFGDRLLLRAQLLAQRADWVAMQQRILYILRLSMLIFALLFILLGVIAATGALATSDGSVNVLLALVTLLALPTISLLLWCLSLVVGGRGQYSSFGLSQGLLWCNRKFVKGPDQGLLINALLSFSRRDGLLRWAVGAINNGLWCLALSAATITMLALLAAKRYRFGWETTLLDADSFVLVVQSLGWLPSLLGFSMPDALLIRQSDGLQLLPAAVQVQWSSWLMGCLVVYGLLPRLLACIVSLFLLQARSRHIAIDNNQSGLVELRQRLFPYSESVGVDAEAGEDQVPKAEVLAARAALQATTLVIGVELPVDQPWPPALMPTFWQDAGLVDSREQRAQLLVRLANNPVDHIVLCVDAEQTPDRGVVAWLAELATYGTYNTVYLLNAEANVVCTGRLDAWFSRLNTAGFTAVYTNFELLLAELE